MARSELRAVVFGGVCVALIGATVWSLRSEAAPPRAAGLPTAQELDSLSRYLAPAAPAPSLDDYAVFLPARRPLRIERIAPPPPVDDTPITTWQLSAILIAGARPVAIINDQTVAAGARLPDGWVVLHIERDHVILRAPNGATRRLSLAAG